MSEIISSKPIQLSSLIVTKSNDLVRTPPKLGLLANRIGELAIAKISPHDSDFEEITINLRGIAKSLNVADNHFYREVKDAVIELLSTSIMHQSEKGFKAVTLVEKAKYFKGTSKLSLTFHRDAKPFLLNIKKNYTSYPAIYTVKCSNTAYSQLYGILKSFLYKRKYVVEDWKDLRDKLHLKEKYSRYGDFKKRVLRGSQTYFLLNTDIAFGIVSETKENRFVKGFEIRIFDISSAIKIKRHFLNEKNSSKSYEDLQYDFLDELENEDSAIEITADVKEVTNEKQNLLAILESKKVDLKFGYRKLDIGQLKMAVEVLEYLFTQKKRGLKSPQARLTQLINGQELKTFHDEILTEQASSKKQPKLQSGASDLTEGPLEKAARQKNLSDLDVWKEKSIEQRMQIRKKQIDELGEEARALYAGLNDNQFSYLWKTLELIEGQNPQVQFEMLYGKLKTASEWEPSAGEPSVD